MTSLVTRLRRKTVAGQPVFPTPIELEAADRIEALEAALTDAVAQMESDAVFHEYDRGHRSISEIPDRDLPDALLHARAALAASNDKGDGT